MSDVRFLYFTKYKTMTAEGFIPVLNKTSRLWSDARLKTNPIYLVPSDPQKQDEQYIYVYHSRGIRYSVHLDEYQNVKAYERYNPIQSRSYKYQGGQETVEDAYLGDHYTIGVEKIEDMPQWMFMSHITLYKPKPSDPTKLQRKQGNTCNMKMDDPIKHTTRCYHTTNMTPLGVLGNYEKYDLDYEIIPILQVLHKKVAGGPNAGGGGQVTYKGRRYKVTIGPRGGRTIVVDGKTVRLSCGAQKGGNDKRRHHVRDGFAEDFVQFIHDYRIAPVFESKPRLSEVVVIDEAENDHLLIRYEVDHGDGMDIVRIESSDFLMPREVVLSAYDIAKKPVDTRTEDEKKELATFKQAPMIPLIAAR